MPPRAAKRNVEGSGTDAGLALNPAAAGVAFDVVATAIESAADGASVTVEPAPIVNVFCRICVAVRLVTFVPSPTVKVSVVEEATFNVAVPAPPGVCRGDRSLIP
jgi:hypothetical protein